MASRRYFYIATSPSSSSATSRSQKYNEYLRDRAAPWYWLLTRTADCKIFQEQATVPQIFEEVVKQYGFTDYQLKLSGTYRALGVLRSVPAKPTSISSSRLMEQEGIYYYFLHEDGQAHHGARR